MWFPVMKTPSHSGDRKGARLGISSKYGRPSGDRMGGDYAFATAGSSGQRTTGHECLLPERCARAAYGSPKDGGRSGACDRRDLRRCRV